MAWEAIKMGLDPCLRSDGTLREDGYYDSSPSHYNEYDSFESYEELLESKNHKKKLEKNIIQKIADDESNKQLKSKILRSLWTYNLDLMTIKYAQEENLPIYFYNIAKETNCIEILLKGYFKQKCKVTITNLIHEEIQSFVKLLLINDNSDIIYDRVGKIQEFIHKKTQQFLGKDSHFGIDKSVTRKILSTSRLHLNIFDLKSLQTEKIINILNKTNKIRSKEYNNLLNKKNNDKLIEFNTSSREFYDVYFNKMNKKYIKNWYYKNSKTLIDYLDAELVSDIYMVLLLDIKIDKIDFQEEIIKIKNKILARET